MASRKHTLIVLVEDHPGVLNRVMSLFRQRGFNADSVAVSTAAKRACTPAVNIAPRPSEASPNSRIAIVQSSCEEA